MFDNKKNIELLWKAVDMLNGQVKEGNSATDSLLEMIEETGERLANVERDIYGDANYIVTYMLSKTQTYEVFASYREARRRMKEVQGFKGVKDVYICEVIEEPK